MVAACQANGVRLMIAYRKYFEPGSVALKELVTRGKLGRLRHIFSSYTEIVDPGKAKTWQLNQRLAGGGSLMDIGIYCVNTMRWVAGSAPLDATAYRWTDVPERFSEVEDSTAFRLTHPDGLVCQGTSSYSSMAASFLQVQGDQGWAALNPAFAFTESIHRGRDPEPDGMEGARDMATIEAIYDRHQCAISHAIRPCLL